MAGMAPDWLRQGWHIIRPFKGRLIGGAVGLAFALVVHHYGFLWAIFICICTAAGYFVGKRIDEDKERWVELLEKYLPPGRT